MRSRNDPANARRTSVLAVLLLTLFADFPGALAQEQSAPTPEAVAKGVKEQVGVAAVRVNPSVEKAAATAGKSNELARIVEAMDSELIDRLHNTRKFQVVARSDLKSILTEQEFAASGNVDANDPSAAKAFALAGCKYLLVLTVDDFQDAEEHAKFEAIGEQLVKRTIRYSAVGKLYNATTGKLLETASFPVSNSDVGGASGPGYATTGNLSDHLLNDMARLMADRVANRVVDVIYPAKILARTGTTVTFNRGDGTGVFTGQVYEVFAVGKELKDPDTGEILGQEEISIGHVRVTGVTPRFSRADVMDDRGIAEGQILRAVLTPPPPGPSQAPAPPQGH